MIACVHYAHKKNPISAELRTSISMQIPAVCLVRQEGASGRKVSASMELVYDCHCTMSLCLLTDDDDLHL